MGKGVGDRTLEDLARLVAEGIVGREVFVEGTKGGEEPGTVGVPRCRLRVRPRLLTPCLRQRPIHQVAEVRQDLRRCPGRG
jgi:hypothetical protein